MTQLLERLGVELVFPPEQTYCVKPLFNNGFEEKACAVAGNFLRAFNKSDAPIIDLSGSCVGMVKHHYIELFSEGTSEHEMTVDISSRIYELTEYLVNVLRSRTWGGVST